MKELDPLLHWFERLTPADVAELPRFYAAEARFVDPFNDVVGTAAIERIFRHMFVQIAAPRFIFHQRFVAGRVAMLTWEMRFRFRGWRGSDEQVIRGATELRFDDEGRVILHRDYWDAAGALYEKLPLVGGVMRWLRRRAAA